MGLWYGGTLPLRRFFEVLADKIPLYADKTDKRNLYDRLLRPNNYDYISNYEDILREFLEDPFGRWYESNRNSEYEIEDVSVFPLSRSEVFVGREVYFDTNSKLHPITTAELEIDDFVRRSVDKIFKLFDVKARLFCGKIPDSE